YNIYLFFFSSRRRHTRSKRDWSSDVCSSDLEIEQDEGRPIEAEIEDEVNDVYLKGEEAFDELYPKVKALSIDKDTDKDEAIKDALETFDLDEDYEKFEIEITFNDGSELEYEDK